MEIKKSFKECQHDDYLIIKFVPELIEINQYEILNKISKKGLIMKQKCGEYCVVLTTCSKKEDAENLSEILIKKRLAACVQVMPISSFYEWKKVVTKSDEFLLFIKSKKNIYEDLEAAISENHPYELPEIVRLPIQAGLPQYLSWIDENICQPS